MQFDTRSLWIYVYFPRLQLDLIEANNMASMPAITGENAKLVLTPTKTKTARIAVQNLQTQAARAVIDITHNKVCQVNSDALRQGIKLGMGLASASLVCADLHLHEYNQDIESQHILNIANHLYLMTSDIVLAPPNALVLRAQNMLNLYGGLQSYWQVIEQVLGKQCVTFIAASDYSIQGAKVLALSQQTLITQERSIIQTQLKKCLLTATDIDQKDLQKLARIGVKTYADLLELPIAEIANRVSRFSMSVINELLGKQAAKVKFYQPKPTYHDYIELLYEISLTDKLLPLIKLCLHKFSEFMLLRNAHCLSIDMQFFQREHALQQHTFSSIQPIYKAHDWLDIISLKLESVKFDSAVYALSIACTNYEVAEIANSDMFAQKTTHIAALTLLSRLQSKLGEKSVRQLNFVSDFRPEHSTQSTALNIKNKYSTISIFADRPGLLLPKPRPLQMKVQVIKGPERIQNGWWDDKPINRDYYIGQSQDGQQVWIFKTPNKEWFLHGYFI